MTDLQECPICSERFGVLIDGPTCVRHTVDEQNKFVPDRQAWLRKRRMASAEKYNSIENQSSIAGWRAGKEKMKEVRN